MHVPCILLLQSIPAILTVLSLFLVLLGTPKHFSAWIAMGKLMMPGESMAGPAENSWLVILPN